MTLFKPPPPKVASPCNSVCTIETVSGLCAGCRRTIDEIANWSMLTEPQKAEIVAALPLRRLAADSA